MNSLISINNLTEHPHQNSGDPRISFLLRNCKFSRKMHTEQQTPQIPRHYRVYASIHLLPEIRCYIQYPIKIWPEALKVLLKPENVTTSITLAVQDVLQMYGLDFNPVQLVTHLCLFQASYQFAKGHWGPFIFFLQPNQMLTVLQKGEADINVFRYSSGQPLKRKEYRCLVSAPA